MSRIEPTTGLGASRRAQATASALITLLISLIASESAGDLLFSPPQSLPGDAEIGTAAGMQEEADVALGGGQFLAVWSDYRSSLDDYPPFATEGSGADIYGARLDADGNVIDSSLFVINQALGDQIEPRVAWNGQSWLVIWKQDTVSLPTYEELRAVRVDADGVVLDEPPIVIHNNQSTYSNAVVAGGAGGWVVLFQANGPSHGLSAVRITGEGSVANPGGTQVHSTLFLLDFDLAFAQDEYLVIWGGPFDSPRGRRYTPDLQPIGTSVLPFAQEVATDATDFLVVRASGPPPLATIDGVLVTHDGTAQSPFTLFTGGNQDGTCCADATWDGSHYWVSWGGPRLARVTPAGEVLDPGGFAVAPSASPISTPRFAGVPGGGLQLAYNDGVNGAGYPKDVHAARIAPSGELGNETVVSLGAPAQVEADFALGDGIHLVAFRSRRSDSGRILVHRLDGSGNALDLEPIEVATGPIPGLGVPTLGPPAVAWNGTLFMVAWSDGLGIFARRILPDGTFVDTTPLRVMDGFDPDVAAVGANFLVVGIDFLLDNPEWQATHSMRVDGATGANLDPEANALGGFVIFAQHPHVVGFGDRWLATWQTNISHDNPAASTKGAFIDIDGATPGVFSVPLGWRPDVAVSGDRALFVAVTNTIASATTDLAGQIMLADGSMLGGAFAISSAPEKQLRPAVSWNGEEFIVVWEDKRNAEIYFDRRTDIYGARIAPDATVLDPAGVPVAAMTVPEIRPALVSIGSTTLLGVSTLRTDSGLGAYRLGIAVDRGGSTGVAAPPGVEATGIRLLGARPNPANPSTTIRFECGVHQPVSLRVFDPTGRLIRTLLDDRLYEVGGAPIEVTWDGRDDAGRPVGSGLFLYELRTPEEMASGKLMMLK